MICIDAISGVRVIDVSGRALFNRWARLLDG